MSVTLTLVPLAVAVGISLSAASSVLISQHKDVQEELPALETAFLDSELLVKTLTQHGLQVRQLGENELVVSSESGTLRYFRQEAGRPFLLELKDITDMRQLLSSVDELNNEYGRNVQTFTYNKVMEGLIEHGMTVDTEEILEDDSILLTLNV